MLNNRYGHYLALITAGALVFLVNLGGPSLWDLDEGRNATAAFEMMSAGEWITPTFNSELRVDKPGLLYWLQIAAYHAFGVNEFAARLPSALAAIATLLLTYELGRRMFGAGAGLIAGLILASSPLVCAAARFANPDALLHLFTLLTLALFWFAYQASLVQQTPRKWLGIGGFLSVGAASGFAVLAKGPVGIVLPAAVTTLFLLWNRQLGMVLNRRLGLGVAAFLLVAAPWYVMVTVDTKGDFAEGFILVHNVQRFTSTMESHRGGPLYYLVVLLVGTAPWSVFLLSSLVYSFRPVFSRKPADQGAADSLTVSNEAAAYRFLWCWMFVYLVFFSISATKLPNYILPMYGSAALLMGRFLDRWRTGTLTLPRWHMPLSLSEIALIGVAIGAGLFIAGGGIELTALRGRFFPELAPWAFLGSFLILGAGCAGWLCRTGKRTAAIGTIAIASIATVSVLAGWGLSGLEHAKAVRALVVQSGARQTEHEIVVGCMNLEYLPSFNFYCKRDIRHCKNDREALTLLRHPQPVFVFMPEKKWTALAARVTTPHQIVGRCRDLYKNVDIVAISNRR